MFYGGLQNEKLLRTFRKHYSGDGTIEIKQNINSGSIEFVIYIGGDGYTAPVVLKSDGVTQNYLYLHRDYQGTIVAVSDQEGAVTEKRLFDAWGNVIKVEDGAGNVLNGLTVLDRGYTGHEHLQSVGIIHMNGRLYDPKLHRFLQPDNYIQEPFNTQNYNKYSYVLNNPLKYTDSSGEAYEIGFFAAVGIGAAIAALTYTITALVADVPFSVGGLVKATFIGAASSAVTFGIGSAAGTITNFYVRAGVSALAHGTFQGGITAISGGKFWSGFASGALSSIASSAFSTGYNHKGIDAAGEMIDATKVWSGAGSFAGSNVGMITFGTVSGGLGAALTKGNIWQGALTGLVVSGLNHFVHQTKIQEFGDVTIEVTDEIVGEQTIRDWPADKGGRYKTPLYKVTVKGTDPEGNVISKDFKAIRFGVKTNENGVKTVAFLKSGTYTIKDFYSWKYSNTGTFQIRGDYLIHMNSLNGPDGNNGCIAIAGGIPMWNKFKAVLIQITGNADLSASAQSGLFKLNINYAPTPKLF
jgi:RHS repeat-associated protein